MCLTHLPLELVEEVVSNLCSGKFAESERAKHYSVLRLVSRDMNQLLLPVVFSQVTLDYHICHRISYESQIATILSPNSPVSQYAKTLRILCLSPLQSRDAKDGRGSFLGKEWEKINKAMAKTAKSLASMVDQNLGALLSAMEHIQTLEYHVDPTQHVQTVVDHMQQMPQLRNLTLVLKEVTPPHIAEAFNNITGLHKLVIQSGPRTRDITVASFSRLIGQNPKLESLSAQGFVAETTLEAVMQHAPESAKPLYIATMNLGTVKLTATALAMRHVQFLEVLDLTRLPPDLDDAGFWRGLTRPLWKIGIGTLKNHHVEFLLSYKGVRELRILNMDKGLSAARIFDEILPRHQNYLRVLALDGEYAQDTIFMTKSLLEKVHQCSQLRKLSIAYRAQDILTKAGATPLLSHTLDVVEALPFLNEVSVGCCQPLDESQVDSPPSQHLSTLPLVTDGATNALFTTIKKSRFMNNDHEGVVINVPQCGVSCAFGRIETCYGFIVIGEEYPPDYIVQPPQFQTAYEVRKDTNVSLFTRFKRIFKFI